MAKQQETNLSLDLSRYAHEKEIRAFCNNSGLNVMFEDEHKPRTDGRTIYVGKPDPFWNADQLVKWKSSIYHEVGHNRPEMRDCFDIPKKYKIAMDSFIGSALNVVDDYRQEHYKYDEYYGRQQVMSKGCYLKQKEHWIDNPKIGTIDDPKWQALESLITWEMCLREDWMKDTVGQSNQMYNKLQPHQQKWVNQLISGDYGDVLNNTPTAEEEYSLVKRIIDEVFQMDSQAEEQAARAAAAAQQGQGNSEQQGSSDGQGDDGDGQGRKKAEGKAKPGEDGEGDSTAGRVNYDELLAHLHDDKSRRSGASYAPLEIDYTDFTRRTFNCRSEREMQLVDYKKKPPSTTNDRYSREIMQKAQASGLVKQLKKLLQVFKQNINIHGQKQGKLSKRSIYRATMKDMEGYNQKVFKKRIDSNILDASVLVLADGSGSMGGSKFTNAARTAILLNEAIASLGMPVEVISFSENGTPIHAVMKGFGEQPTSEEIARRFSNFSDHYMGSNSDGESILWAVPRLMSQRTSKKIMIVLSDGQPASNGGDAMTFTQKVVKEIEKRKDIEIYGIGIQSSTVKQIYSNNYVINTPEEIESAVFSIIKNRVINN